MRVFFTTAVSLLSAVSFPLSAFSAGGFGGSRPSTVSGAINPTSVGATTPGTGAFTTLSAVNQLTINASPSTSYSILNLFNGGNQVQLAVENSVGTGYGAPAYGAVWYGGNSSKSISLMLPGEKVRLESTRLSFFSGVNMLMASGGKLQFGAYSDVTFSPSNISAQLESPGANIIAMRNGANEQTFSLGPTGTSAGIKSNAGELQSFDSAGNLTTISPHAMDGPASLYDADEPYPQVSREANAYLGSVRYVNATRQRAGRAGWEHIETFAEHNTRLGLTGDRALQQLDWDTVQAGYVADREKERNDWNQKKTAAIESATLISFLEQNPEPPVYQPKSKPGWLSAAADRKAAQLVSRSQKASLQSSAFLALRTDLSTNLGITINSPDDLIGKVDEVIPAAKSRREAKATTPDRLAELEKQVELLTRFVVFLSRK